MREEMTVVELKTIQISRIQPNPFQPREHFEKESLVELADSMKDSRIVQPIIVKPHGSDYRIIAGERRWRAAQMAGLTELPCIVKDIAEERILLESLVENLHRKDLTDIERENAIHNLWKKRETLGIESKAELAKVLGVSETRIKDDVEAWEFRHQEEGIPTSTPTYIISRTQGLPDAERKKIIEKVDKGELQAKEAYTAIKVLHKAPIVIKKELLKPKSRMTPKMAEVIVTNVPNEREQRKIVREIDQFRLTEDEVEDRIREISRASKDAPLQKEMVVHEGTVYTVGEYECPHCKRHYLIRCDGKRDWVE